MEKQIYIPAVNATVKTEKAASQKCCSPDCPHLKEVAMWNGLPLSPKRTAYECSLFDAEVRSYTGNGKKEHPYERLQKCKDAEDAEKARTPAEKFGKTALRGLNILQCCYCSTIFVQTDKNIASCPHCHCKETQPFYVYGL